MRFVFVALLALVNLSSMALASDRLVILSPHRKSIQREFLPLFKEWYRQQYQQVVDVEWLDQGGTSDDVRFLKARFNKKEKSAGIDLFWGGGAVTFLDLERQGYFMSYALPKSLSSSIPQSVAGIPLYDRSQSWYATAMSSFGIFYNKKILQLDGMPIPLTWADLGHKNFYDQVSITDPRRSGTAYTMNTIILQALGWERGWQLLTRIAANARSFSHSSSDPIKLVVAGDTAAALAIDFYAIPKVAEFGEKNLGFTLPKEHTIIDPDPIAIIRGAPNRKVAERFVNFVLSVRAQTVLMLPKGVPGGPKYQTLGRMAVNLQAYHQTKGLRVHQQSPFTHESFFRLDADKAAKVQQIFNDLYGVLLVDMHQDLKRTWVGIMKSKNLDVLMSELSKPPISEKELVALAARWHDNIFRNQTINQWMEFAVAKYRKLSNECHEHGKKCQT